MGRRTRICIKFQNLNESCQAALMEYIKREGVDVDIKTVEVVGYKPIIRRLTKVDDALYRVEKYGSWQIPVGRQSWLYRELNIDKKTFKRWCEFGVFGTDITEYNSIESVPITDISWCDIVKRMKKYLICHQQD